MIPKSEWVWMPHAGHLIVGNDCRFHLATRIGKWIVSTVGEYIPDSEVRELLARTRGVKLEGMGDNRLADYMKKVGYEEIGLNRKYETMVFRAKRAKDCCPWRMKQGNELDMAGYNDPTKAYKGHFRMCEKWAAKEVRP